MSQNPLPEETPTSWREAHTRYCEHHGTLQASIQNVVSFFQTKDDYELGWELPKADSVATTIPEFLNSTTTEAIASSETRSAPPMWKRFATSLVDSFFQDDLDEVDSDYAAQDQPPSSSNNNSLNWNVPIVHVALVNQCLETVEQSLEQEEFIIMCKSEWKTWLSQIIDKSLKNADFLLDILVVKQKAKILERRYPLSDLIVLYPAITDHQQLDVQVALFDLKDAQETLSKQMQEWASQMVACRQKALHYKKQNFQKLALLELKKVKLLDQRIDSSTNALLKLEQTQATIELAQNNSSLLQRLQLSAQQLKKLTQEFSLEEINNLQDELQEETEKANEIQEAMTASSTSTADDDVLWKELQSLTLENKPSKEVTKEPANIIQTVEPKPTSSAATTQQVKETKEKAPVLA